MGWMMARLMRAVSPVVLFLMLPVSCQKRVEEPKMPDTDLGQLSRDVGLSLPPSARVVGVRREKGIDDAVVAKLEMPAADWDRLAAAAPVRGADFAPENKGYLPSDDGWWDPNRASGVQAAQIQMPKGRILNVAVDRSSKPGTAVVYLMNHGT